MIVAALPDNENARLAALHRYGILDTLAEQGYDDITRLAAHVGHAPIALVSLVDRERLWFKSRIGLEETGVARELGFCAHALLNQPEPLLIPDAAADPRFADNPLVTGEPRIRFYLGMPLVTPDHYMLGTLCIMDHMPRTATPDQIDCLGALARQVVSQFELRRHAQQLERAAADREVYLAQLESYQSKLQEANLRLQEQSLTDALTGLGNRAAFDQRLAEELYRYARYRSPLALLFIDVDKFKDYNDSYGHPAGDEALRSVARALRGCIRPSDFIARYGGEEFAVILPTTGAEAAGILAERLRKTVAAAPFAHRDITVSIGAASAAPDVDAARLIAAADQALYLAKQRGRDRVAYANAG